MLNKTHCKMFKTWNALHVFICVVILCVVSTAIIYIETIHLFMGFPENS